MQSLDHVEATVSNAEFAREWLRSQDPVLVQQGVDDDPEEKRHDHGNQKDGLERMPGTLGVTRLTAADAAASPDFAATILARRRIVAAGRRPRRHRRHRRRDVAARCSHPHFTQLRSLAGGMTVRFRRLFRRRLESRRQIHLKER